MTTHAQIRNIEKHKLNLETAEIAWFALGRHFARGRLIFVHEALDLVDVAQNFADDNRTQVESWLESQQVHPVTDEQDRRWYAEQALFWAVVVKPWFLCKSTIAITRVRIDS